MCDYRRYVLHLSSYSFIPYSTIQRFLFELQYNVYVYCITLFNRFDQSNIFSKLAPKPMVTIFRPFVTNQESRDGTNNFFSNCNLHYIIKLRLTFYFILVIGYTSSLAIHSQWRRATWAKLITDSSMSSLHRNPKRNQAWCFSKMSANTIGNCEYPCFYQNRDSIYSKHLMKVKPFFSKIFEIYGPKRRHCC